MDEQAQVDVEPASDQALRADGDVTDSADQDPAASEGAARPEDESDRDRSPLAPSANGGSDDAPSSEGGLPETPPADTEPAPEEPAPDAVVTRLEQRLDQALQLAQRRDDLVDRLHSENQQLREGELQAALLPLLRDLMRLHDDLEQIIAVASDARDAVLIRDALADILARNGVTKFTPTDGSAFDSALHAAVGAEPTDDEHADRTIQSVRRAGFVRDDGSTVRVADVIVWKFRPRPPESADTETDESLPQLDADHINDDERN